MALDKAIEHGKEHRRQYTGMKKAESAAYRLKEYKEREDITGGAK